MGFSLSPLCVCMLLGGAKGQVVTSAEYDPPVVEIGLSLLLTRISWDSGEEKGADDLLEKKGGPAIRS